MADPLDPAAPAPAVPPGRAVDDPLAMRKAVYDRALGAVRAMPPLENQAYQVRLRDVGYADPEHFSKAQRKHAVLTGGTLQRRIRGTMELVDKGTGHVVDSRKLTVASIPHVNDDGTFTLGGIDYTLASQPRLRPGIFTRWRESGEIESHVNVAKGLGHHLLFEPDASGTGTFRLAIGQAKLPLLPILEALGATRQQLEAAWGPELLHANAKVRGDNVLDKLAEKLVRHHQGTADERRAKALDKLRLMELDPEVTRRTLGEPHARLGAEPYLAATRKLLALSRGGGEPDDRDHLAFMRLMGPEDLIAERIEQAPRSLLPLLWRATNKKSLDPFLPGFLDRHVRAAIRTSGIGSALEEVGPAEILGQTTRLTRMGQGGISSVDSIPDSSRAVQPSHLGFIDPLLTPESLAAGVDLRAAHRLRKDQEGRAFAPFRDPKTGAERWATPQELADKAVAFAGELERGKSHVRGIDRGRLRFIPRDKVDLVAPPHEETFNHVANLVPLKSAAKGQRVMMGARMITQALALTDPEAPLVQTGVPGSAGESYHERFGRKLGAVHADDSPQGGTVLRVDPDAVVVRHPDGTRRTYELHNYLPYNRKSVSGTSRLVIRRENGSLWEGTIAEYGAKQKSGDCVLSIDPATKQSSWQRVTGYLKLRNDKRLLRVTTNSGRSVTVTTDHSLVTVGDTGELVPIYPLDCIVGRTRLPVAMLPAGSGERAARFTSYNYGLLAGLYLAEGHLCEQRGLINIAVTPDNSRKQVRRLVEQFGCVPHRDDGRAVKFTDHELYDWLGRHFGRLAGKKFVSSEALSATPAFLRGVVAGYFAGDGCLHADGNSAIQVAAVSTSRRLRDGLASVLSLLGVFVTFFDAPRKERNENWEDGFGLRVGSGYLHLLDRWFFYDDREVSFRRLLKAQYRASVYEMVPVPEKARRLLYAGLSQPISNYIYKTAGLGAVAKHRLQGCRGVFGDWGRSDVNWDVIESIVPAPHERFVYDLEVAHSEVFAVDGGLVVHNSFLHQTPAVREGERVAPGQLLATSNFTDAKGTAAFGRNLRVAYLPFQGESIEDAIVVSESAARHKLISQHGYQHELDWSDPKVKRGKRAFLGLFPGKYDRRMLETVDDDGVVKPGTVVRHGDPLVLAARERVPGFNQVSRKAAAAHADASLAWEHEAPGVVTDVAKTEHGATVFVRSEHPLQVGDKLANLYGGKGVVSKILPDSQMPHTADGRPMDALLNSLGLTSRTNPAQIHEATLGRIAEHTGTPYKVQDFHQVKDLVEFVRGELQKHGLPAHEDLIDPATGRKLPAIGTGTAYILKLHHESESKAKGRSIGAYDAEELPARGGDEGSKRNALMHSHALLSHGATDILSGVMNVRGQENAELWSKFMSGQNPGQPRVPLVNRKFFALLQAAGLHPQRTGPGRLRLQPLTDAHTRELAGDRELENAELVDWRGGLEPVPGGLFDPALTGGHGGNRWSALALHEPVLNPLLEEPAAKLLGVTGKKLEAVLAGREELDGATGPRAVGRALDRLDLDREIARARLEIKGGRKTARDQAVKRLRYLKGAQQAGVHPRDWLLTRVPVLPPAFRPVNIMRDNGLPLVADANLLYRDLFEANQNLKHLAGKVANPVPEREALRAAVKALVGLGEPLDVKNRERGVRGFLDAVLGSSPKYSFAQQKLLGRPVDTVGRSVITPDADYGLDDIGVPEAKAWEVYRPFLARRLVRHGLAPVEALRQVKDQTPLARKALEDELRERPVIADRAPVLHRYGVMAFRPRLVPGHKLVMNPYVLKGFGADFDGNCAVYDTEICLELDWLALYASLQDSEQETWKEWRMRLTGEHRLVTQVGSGDRSVALVKIGDFPRTGRPRKDRNGADVYRVPAGVRVLSYNHADGAVGFYPVTDFTVHKEHACALVRTRTGLEVEVSDNESLAAYDRSTGEIVKISPADCVGRLVPYLKEAPIGGDVYDRDAGWWYAVLAADGWVSERTIGYSKNDADKRMEFVRIAHELLPGSFHLHEYVEEARAGKFGDSAKLHLNGVEPAAAVLPIYEDRGGERGALYKKIPDALILRGSRACRLGLLSGLLDGDALVRWSRTKKKRQFDPRVYTSSAAMVRSIRLLGRSLGLRLAVTTTSASGRRHEAYTITFSLPDLHRLAPELTLVGVEARELFAEFAADAPPKESRDLVPVPAGDSELVRWLSRALLACKQATLYSAVRKAAADGFITRFVARKVLEACQDAADAPAAELRAWALMVENDRVFWDRYVEVEAAPVQDVFDLVVPDTKVYAIASGLIVYDTMNWHVPFSEDEVREALERLLPSKNLLSAKTFHAHQLPVGELKGGLYLASADRDDKKPVKSFRHAADVLAAFWRGELAHDQPVAVHDES